MIIGPAAFGSRFREVSAKREKKRRLVNNDPYCVNSQSAILPCPGGTWATQATRDLYFRLGAAAQGSRS